MDIWRNGFGDDFLRGHSYFLCMSNIFSEKNVTQNRLFIVPLTINQDTIQDEFFIILSIINNIFKHSGRAAIQGLRGGDQEGGIWRISYRGQGRGGLAKLEGSIGEGKED